MKRFRLSSQGETGLPQFGSLQQAPPESNVSMTRAIPTPGKPAAGASGHSRPGSAANGQQSGIMPAPSLHEVGNSIGCYSFLNQGADEPNCNPVQPART